MTKIVVFGEDLNDTRALRELILGLCPVLSPGDVRIVREPPTLQRGTHPRAIRTWVERAAAALRGAQVILGELTCIFAHTDADGPDDGSFERSRTLELRAAGFEQSHAVVPVECIEAWWLLFPEATERVVPSWSGALLRRARDVERIRRPKDELVRRTSNKQPRRPYREGDSPAVARSILASGIVRSPSGTSGSFSRFVSTVDGCCSMASLHHKATRAHT